jgi:hypothetical protein
MTAIHLASSSAMGAVSLVLFAASGYAQTYKATVGQVAPVAVRAFPDEIYTSPRSWTERAYPKLIHYNRLPKGGHFAAWEQAQLFTSEFRAAFGPLRKSEGGAS